MSKQYVIYDINSFVADWGGYMGLILGFRKFLDLGTSQSGNHWNMEILTSHFLSLGTKENIKGASHRAKI